jgi:hypothetical protein
VAGLTPFSLPLKGRASERSSGAAARQQTAWSVK